MRILTAIAAAVLLAAPVAGIAQAQTASEYNAAGFTHYSEKRLPDAIDSFDKALKLDPASLTIRSNLATACHGYSILLSKSGDLERAIDLERRAFELDGGNQGIRTQLALYYNDLGRRVALTGSVSRARSLMSEAMQLLPRNLVLVTNMCALLVMESRELLKNGNDSKAGQLLDEAAGLDPGNIAVHVALGEFHYGRNDYARSIASLERALELNPAETNVASRLEQIRKESAVEKGFIKNDRYRFAIRYEDGVNEELSWNVSGILNDAYREIGQKLGFWPSRQLTAIIYSQDQFKAVTSAPDWTAGRFDGKLRIRITDFTRQADALTRVVRHEYAHALIFDLYGSTVPVWINEGFAQYAASESGVSDDEARILGGAGLDRLPAPWNLGDHFASTNGASVALAYLESRLFMQYMFNRYGNHTTRLFILASTKEPDLGAITHNMFNQSPEQLMADWIADLRRKTAP
ncbi:MAG: tetratricopeptide repeat protein [bacterium]